MIRPLNPLPDEAVNSNSTRFLIPLVFIAGMVSIGVELSASRLLAPYFGTSTFVWSNLIGFSLAYLALGYYLGGRIADRRPDVKLLYGLIAVAGLSIMLIPTIAKPIMEISLPAIDSADAGAFLGSMFTVILLMAVPMTLLGCVTPFAIRLRIPSVGTAGSSAGNVWAISTSGSILGSFIPTVVMVPLLGTSRTFLLLGGLLAVTAGLASLTIAGRVLPVVAVTAAAIGMVVLQASVGADQIKPADRGVLVEEAESAYHYIQVLDDDGVFLLALNEGHAIHSIYDPNNVITAGPWDYFSLAPLFLDAGPLPIEKAAIVGIAGGTAARTMLDIYPEAQIDGFEIDSKIIELGRRYFSLSDPRIDTEHGDGRYLLRESGGGYQTIALDAYRQPYVPFHLATQEFFDLTSDRLDDSGVVAVNAGRTATDYRLVEALASTMMASFEHVFLVDVGAYENTMIFATNAPSSLEAFKRAATELDPTSTQGIIAGMALTSGNPRLAIATIAPYTDDDAPIEMLVDRMILDAAREGE